MITEMSRVRIVPGKEEYFETLFYKCLDEISTLNGFVAGKLSKSLESPGLYYMILEWETVEHRVAGFPNSTEAQKIMPMLLPLYDAPSQAEHLVDIPRRS